MSSSWSGQRFRWAGVHCGEHRSRSDGGSRLSPAPRRSGARALHAPPIRLGDGVLMATGQQAEPQTAKLMDPVCGLRLDPATVAGSSEYAGRTFYFPSAACKAEFDAQPERLASRGGVDPSLGRATRNPGIGLSIVRRIGGAQPA